MKFLILGFVLAAAVVAEDVSEEIKKRAIQNPDLYDGDIAGIDGPFDLERNVIPGQNYRWPGARIPYVIDASLNNGRNAILSAFQHYHSTTCVRFSPRNGERDFIRLFYGNGCYSMIGRIGGQQEVSLGNGCLDVGTIVHELGHALGFYHEQSRSDRDSYLIIYIQNVQSGMEHNFNKLSPSQNILYTNFDYHSIMIYANDAFSKNGQATMIARNGQRLTNAYTKSGMTGSDITRVKKMYNC